MPFKTRVLLIVLLEGFVTLSIQVLTIRQLIPFVGNSVVVTSTIIAIFLLVLAIAYYRGGQVVGDYYKTLRRNFIYAAGLCGVGLSYLFIENLFHLSFTLSINPFAMLVIYLSIVTAPTVYLLGQTIPIATNLSKANRVGEISGTTLFLSTLGSFVGSIATTVILFNYFGVGVTVFINSVLLSILVLLLMEKPSLRDFPSASGLAIICLVAFFANVHMERSVFVKANVHANYQVGEFDEATIRDDIETNPGMVMTVNRTYSSFINEKRQGFHYIEKIKHILFTDLKITNKNILVLGAGGFSLSAESNYGNAFTYVDIDPEIENIASTYFIGTIDGNFIAQDARTFLINNENKYDVIVSDTYSSNTGLPFHLLTAEHFANIKKSVKNGGLAVFNVIGKPSLSDNYSKRLDNTIRAVFHNCMSSPVNYRSNDLTNIIYTCYVPDGATDEKLVLYTDDRNTSTIDYFRWSAMHRKE